jgi:ribosome-binding protein aMBF1 (putative translation factor)
VKAPAWLARSGVTVCFDNGRPESSRQAGAQLSIASRQIQVKFSHKLGKCQRAKPLPESIQKIGGWIRAKRNEKNLTSCHLAAKMDIAPALVHSWEDGTGQSNDQRLRVLTDVLEIQIPLATPEMKRRLL